MISEKLHKLLSRKNINPYKGPFPERMLQWADELESGDYEQINYRLHSEDGYCCLGVACDLYSRITHKGKFKGYTFYWDEDEYEHKERFEMPSNVADWFGGLINPIECTEEEINTGCWNFAYLNDREKLTFKDIAYIIRESVRLGREG